eukprot:1371831-Amorphochlora_amoeboformis.AAC.2
MSERQMVSVDAEFLNKLKQFNSYLSTQLDRSVGPWTTRRGCRECLDLGTLISILSILYTSSLWCTRCVFFERVCRAIDSSDGVVSPKQVVNVSLEEKKAGSTHRSATAPRRRDSKLDLSNMSEEVKK